MIDWWSSLLLEKQIFYAIGLASILILLIQILLTFVGIDSHHDAELSHGDHSSGLSFLSVRTITAFFVGFGWTGVILLNHSYSVPVAIAGGMTTGILFLLVTAFLIHNLLRLQSSGNLDYQNAIGVVGSVYTTIPGAERGGGQIELMLQGRLMMAEAYTKAERDLKPGSKARVVELIGASTLLVEPLTNPIA
ncbi:MAG: hypothetical protein H0V54_16705 [Chthoniobacterales bacterium]|nr:hypothetical protein [Chthoniobacterales bacterium]